MRCDRRDRRCRPSPSSACRRYSRPCLVGQGRAARTSRSAGTADRHSKMQRSSCAPRRSCRFAGRRSEEHTSELQSLMRISYAVFCLKKKTNITQTNTKEMDETNIDHIITTAEKQLTHE